MVKKEATVTWLTGMTFDAELGDHHLTMDAKSGFGDNRAPTPVMLLLASLGGCTAMDVVSILRKKRQSFDGITIRVEGEQLEEHPNRFTDIKLVYEITGDGIDPKAVARAVELSEEKYCSVAASLRMSTNIGTQVVVNGDTYEG